MKKLLMLILTGALVLGLAACSKPSTDEEKDPAETPAGDVVEGEQEGELEGGEAEVEGELEPGEGEVEGEAGAEGELEEGEQAGEETPEETPEAEQEAEGETEAEGEEEPAK